MRPHVRYMNQACSPLLSFLEQLKQTEKANISIDVPSNISTTRFFKGLGFDTYLLCGFFSLGPPGVLPFLESEVPIEGGMVALVLVELLVVAEKRDMCIR